VGTPSSMLAKLSRPRLYDAVPRERLFLQLDGLRQHPLVWIAAPPGAGKTTLVASWLETRALSGIWYQIDSGDTDPATFFYYLGLAARPWQHRHRPLPLLTPEFLGDAAGFARRWCRDLFARLGPDHVLVLDNLNELPEGSPLLLALAAAAEEVPAAAQMIIVSRQQPGTVFARLSANKTLGVIDAESLRLTPEETGTIAAVRIQVDAARIQELHNLSAGWAAGLSLIVERIRRGLPDATAVGPDSLQDVFDYFAGQIHDRTSRENQRILLKLAFFPRLTPELAVAATGDEQARPLLEYLYHRRLFVERRSPAGPAAAEPVYQFHALFRAFLRRQAAAAYSRPELRGMANTSAILLRQRGQIDDAFPLYAEAEDWAGAADLLHQHADSYLRQGRRQLLNDWLARLPEQVRESDPWLLYWAGTVQMGADPVLARAELERAYQVAVAKGERACQVQSAAAIVESVFLDYTQFSALDGWITVLEQAVNEEPASTDLHSLLRVYAALVAAVCHRQGNPAALRGYVARTLELLSSDAEINLRLAAGTYLLRYGTSLGEMEFVRQVLPQVERLAQDAEATPLARGFCEMLIGWSHVNQLDHSGMDASVARVESLAEKHGLSQLRRFAAIPALWSALIRGQLREAEIWLGILGQILSPDRLYDLATHAAGRALCALCKKDYAGGLRAAREAAQLYDQLGSSWHQLFGRGLLMWAHVELDEFAEAERCIDEAAALSERFNLHVYDVYRHQARAIMALKRGDRTGMETSLRELFECAARHGAGMPARFFLTWMPRLCREALLSRISCDYVRELIHAFGWRCEGAPIEEWPWPVRIYALGRFELYVGDQPLARASKPPRKLLLLLKALVCMGGAKVRDHRLIDALWPEDEADAARAAFTVTLHRLRKLLGHTEAIQVEDGLVSLDPQLCWVDALAFEGLASDAPAVVGHSPGVERALALYRGSLLPGDEDEPWAAAARERLRSKFVRTVGTQARRLEELGQWESAAALYSRGLDADELTESFYQGLMRCYQGLGRPAEAMSAYRRLHHTLVAALGLNPSADTEALRRQIGTQQQSPV
jgi:LuxR family transcriptional regulator, maltose regulon positive regulatory protein